MSRAGMPLSIIFILSAITGPWVSPLIFGFDPFEQHHLFLDSPPFSKDVPMAYQSFDHNTKVFDQLDLDHDGRLIILHTPQGSTCAELERIHLRYHELEQAFLSHTLNPEQIGLQPGQPLDLQKFIEATRWMRLTIDSLKRMDKDRDGVVTPQEFLGAPETRTFVFGTDALGRDILARTIRGLFTSVVLALIAGLTAFVLGLSYGVIAGHVGGWTDHVMMRFVDVLYGLPYIMLVVVLIALLGPGFWNLVLAVVIVQWLPVARLARPLAASISQEPYVEASFALGAPTFWVLRHHVIPQVLKPSLSMVAILTSNVVRQEVLLSFLGLGITPPTPSLGTLIADGVENLTQAPWEVFAPAGAVFLLLLVIQLLQHASNSDR